jgi:hypothetical protein
VAVRDVKPEPGPVRPKETMIHMMKRILILGVALGWFLCSTTSAFQGGGGESTKKAKKKVTRKVQFPVMNVVTIVI